MAERDGSFGWTGANVVKDTTSGNDPVLFLRMSWKAGSRADMRGFGGGGTHGGSALVRLAALIAGPAVAFAAPAHAERAATIEPPAVSASQTPAAPLQRLALNAADLRVEDVSGAPGEAIPVRIHVPPVDTGEYGLVMVRGLPKGLSLTPGFRTGDTWMLSIKELDGLELKVPDDFAGTFSIEVIFVYGRSRETRTASVTIDQNGADAVNAAPEQLPTSANAALPTEPQPEPAPAVHHSALSPAVEKAMADRALDQLKNGDVAAARLIYEHLAANGSALGALSMAKTYDPEVLLGLGVVGMRPDPAEARRWYQRAAELGSEPAAQRLRSLASGQ